MDLEKWNYHRLEKKKKKKKKRKRKVYFTNKITIKCRGSYKTQLSTSINLSWKLTLIVMITPLICVTICLKRYLVLKENTNKIPGGVHPGTKVYQEWGNILANRINTSFSRSAGVAGACRPSSPHKALDPCPVDDCSTDRQWVSQTGSTKTIKSDHGNRGTKNINNLS